MQAAGCRQARAPARCFRAAAASCRFLSVLPGGAPPPSHRHLLDGSWAARAAWRVKSLPPGASGGAEGERKRPLPEKKHAYAPAYGGLLRALAAFMFVLPVIEAYYRLLVLCIEKLKSNTLEMVVYTNVRLLNSVLPDPHTPDLTAQYHRLIDVNEQVLQRLMEASELLAGWLAPCFHTVSAVPQHLQWLAATFTSPHALVTLSLLVLMLAVSYVAQQLTEAAGQPQPQPSAASGLVQDQAVQGPRAVPVAAAAAAPPDTLRRKAPPFQPVAASMYCALLLWLGSAPFLVPWMSSPAVGQALIQTGSLCITILVALASFGAAFRLLKTTGEWREALAEVVAGTQSVVFWQRILAAFVFFCWVFTPSSLQARATVVATYALYSAMIEYMQARAQECAGMQPA